MSDNYSPTVPTGDERSSAAARVLGVVAVLAFIAFWVYVFANRDSVTHPDEFSDPVWTAAAEAVCSASQSEISALTSAASAETPQARGELVAQGTAALEAMLAELDALGLPDDAKGAETVPRWLSDYQIYLQDRRVWTEILRTGEDPPFLISGNADGVRVTDLLTTFAEVNSMASCAPSGDA